MANINIERWTATQRQVGNICQSYMQS